MKSKLLRKMMLLSLALALLIPSVDPIIKAKSNDRIGQDNVAEIQDDDSEDDGMFAGGSGTEDDPYLIQTAKQLDNIRLLNSYKERKMPYFKLIEDIDLSEYENWIPIGTESNPFVGTFDGDGHSISQLQIYKTSFSEGGSSAEYIGLFGCAQTGGDSYYSVIKNLTLEDVDIQINIADISGNTNYRMTYVGGIVAYQALGMVSNCETSGKISIMNGYDVMAGGITSGGSKSIQNCTNNIDIYAEGTNRSDYRTPTVRAGGIAGNAVDTIEDCINYGEIEAEGGWMTACGGIAGDDVRKVLHSANYGEITGKNIDGYSNPDLYIGGIIGHDPLFLDSCVNFGNIYGESEAVGIGGIAGISGGFRLFSQKTIKNCYNMASEIECSYHDADGAQETDYELRRIDSKMVNSEDSPNIDNCYSLYSTRVNGKIPTEEINVNEKNGSSLTYDVIKDIIEEELGFEVLSHDETVIGKLEYVNIGNFSVTIDGAIYFLNSTSFKSANLYDLRNKLENSSDKMFIAQMKNNEIVRIDEVANILKPTVTISTDERNLTYQNDKYNILTFDVDVNISYEVTSLYDEEAFEEYRNYQAFAIDLQNIHLESSTEAMYFDQSIFGGLNHEFTDKLDVKLYPGETWNYNFTVQMNEDYVPEKINNFWEIEVSAEIDDETMYSSYKVNCGNLDIERDTTPWREKVNKAKELLNGFQIGLDRTVLSQYLTKTQIDDMEYALKVWVGNLISTTDLIHEDDYGYIDRITELLDMTKEQLMEKVMKKLGINQNILTFSRNTSATTIFEATSINGEQIKICFDLNMNYNAFKDSHPYSGMGVLKYYVIEEDGKKKDNFANSMITYANTSEFFNQMKKVAESAISGAYSESWGKKADSVVSLLCDENINYLLKKTKISFSGSLFKLLTAPTVNNKRVGIHCPVDVYVFNSSGEKVGEIVNNKVNETFDEIYMYTEGDDKYIYLDNDLYTLKLKGTDAGTMDYEINEYTNEKVTRTLNYSGVPLTEGIEYVSFVPQSNDLDSEIYDLVSDTGDVIQPDSDTLEDETNERIYVDGVFLSAKKVELTIGDQYSLEEKISPDNASIQLVEWETENDAIATVDQDGTITAIGEGETVVSVKTIDGDFVAECVVHVRDDQKENDSEESQTPPSDNDPSANYEESFNRGEQNKTSPETSASTFSYVILEFLLFSSLLGILRLAAKRRK